VTVLRLNNVTVSFQGKNLIRNASLEVPANEVTSLVGPSGAGKSTLLRALNRLIDEDPGFERSGDIWFREAEVGGLEPNRLRRSMALIFQRPVIFPISIRKNVLFGVRHLGLYPKQQFPEVAERFLREAFLWDEVKDRLDRPALELSVGQQQRLAIARTLALEPEVLLMDEPTSALDVHATRKIEELILSLKKDRTIVLVTHQPRQALELSRQLVFLYPENGCGEIVFRGTPEDLLRRPHSLPPYFQEVFAGTTH
jgi:phosphate transport system ATP-binding protein